MGLLLLIIAKLLSWVLFPLGWFYSLITFRLRWGRLSEYSKQIAISIDQMGNVVLANLLNDLMIKRWGYKFGDPDDTISAVLGKNKAIDSLKIAGKILSSILNKIEPNHVEKAANSKNN
jgi:8-oxo-dGTP diphosphatase